MEKFYQWSNKLCCWTLTPKKWIQQMWPNMQETVKFFFFFGRYLLLILDGMNLWKLFQKFNSLSFSLRILVNCNVLSLARNFQHRFKFFKRNIAHNMRTIKLKVKYHARRVKFHFCGLSNVNWISLDNKCICSKWKLNK